MGIKDFFAKHSGSILTGCAIVGSIATAYFGYRGGLKARELMEERWRSENDPMEPPPSDIFRYYTPKEVISTTWKAWGPTVGACIVTIASIAGLRCVDTKIISNISAVANVAQITNDTLRKNIAEKVGEEQAREIERKTNTEVVQKISESRKPTRVIEKYGTDGQVFVLANDPNIIFRMDPNQLQSEINDLNAQLVAGHGEDIEESKCGSYLPYNVFLHRIGAEMISDGWDKGWPCIEYSKSPFIIEPYFEAGNFDNGASYSILNFMHGPYYCDDPLVWKYAC